MRFVVVGDSAIEAVVALSETGKYLSVAPGAFSGVLAPPPPTANPSPLQLVPPASQPVAPPPSAAPRERERKAAEPRRASVEPPPLKPALARARPSRAARQDGASCSVVGRSANRTSRIQANGTRSWHAACHHHCRRVDPHGAPGSTPSGVLHGKLSLLCQLRGDHQRHHPQG